MMIAEHHIARLNTELGLVLNLQAMNTCPQWNGCVTNGPAPEPEITAPRISRTAGESWTARLHG